MIDRSRPNVGPSIEKVRRTPRINGDTVKKICKRFWIRWVFLVFLTNFSHACRLLEKHDADADSIVDDSKPNEEVAGKAPPNLWSPTMRKSSAGYYFMVAETISLKEKDARKALPLYELAYSLDPNPFLGGKMLMAKAISGQRTEALLEARRMALLYPQDANLHFFYGDLLAGSGQLPQAAEQLEKAIELNPQMENAYLLLTQVYQGQQDQGKAIVVANELVRNQPGSIAGWSQLSRLYLVTRRYREALVPAKRAWEMQSSNPQLTQIYAITLQLNGKTAQAMQIYEQLYRMDPSDEELTARMVDLYRELGNLESALELLEEMGRKDTTQKRPVIQMQKAILLWELKRNGEATELLEGVLKQYPDSDRVRYLTGFASERERKYERALEIYRSIPDQSSLKNEADLRILLIFRLQKNWQAAFEQARRLLDHNSLSWEGYGIVASVYGDADNFQEAVKVAQTGYQKFPNQPRLLYIKGVYQEKMGDIAGCMATMRLVTQKDPTNSSAFNFLGYLYAERGENLTEAERLVLRALELKPDDGFYLDSLGWIYYQKNQLDKAILYLERALKKEPLEGAIMEHLADAYFKKGEKAKALQWYQNAAKSKLTPKELARIKDKLKTLGANNVQ